MHGSSGRIVDPECVVRVTPEGENPDIVKVYITEGTLKLSKKINLDQFKPGENLNMAVTGDSR